MITVNSKQMRAAIDAVMAAPYRRSSVPVLRTLRARANGAFEIEGTDLEFTALARVPYQGEESAPFLIGNGTALGKAIRLSGETEAAIVPLDSGTGLTLKAGALERSDNCKISPDDWPESRTMGRALLGVDLGADFMRALARIMPAVSTEETRYYLNGVYLHHVEGWSWRLVATDGHRLHMADLSLPDVAGAEAFGFDGGVIIPRKMVAQIAKRLGKGEGPFRLEVAEAIIRNSEATTAPERRPLRRTMLSGRAGGIDIRYFSKEIDGTYPDYRRVIPNTPGLHAIVSADALRRAVDCLTAGVKSGNVPAMQVSFTPGKMSIVHAYTAGDTVSRYAIDCQHANPEDFKIGFNGRYLADCAAAMAGRDIRLAMEDSASPMLINDVSDATFRIVLMPMRV